MAYAAVISLKQTINRLLKSPHISSLLSNPEILELAHKNVASLQQVLERSDDSRSGSRKTLNSLDAEIKGTVHKLEDLLEFEVSDHFLSASYENEKVRQEIDSLTTTMKKKEKEYVKELENSSLEESDDDDNADISLNMDFGVKMVGLSKEFNHIKSKLLKRVRPDDFGVFSFLGMAGSGRSMIAKTIFEHIYDGGERSLDCGAMVTIGNRYELKEILLSILDQVKDPSRNDEFVLEGDEGLLGEKVYSSLKGRKYMIVIDDIWKTSIWDDLRRSFPDQSNGSLVIITTSFKDVALYANCCWIFQIPVLDDDRTWDVLRVAIFGLEASCPRETEESGKAIARNCEGRRLSFAKVVLFLLKAKNKKEMKACCNEIAEDKEHPVFVIPDELLEVNNIVEDIQLLKDSCLGNSRRTSAI